MNVDIIVPVIIKSVADAMDITVNYEVGRASDIVKSLILNDESVTFKDKKYPLLAMVLPVTERRGLGFYATVTIPRIVIATYSNNNSPIFSRYESGGTFKDILYPIYYNFLSSLVKNPNVNVQDVDMIPHTKRDSPGEQPTGEGLQDYVDFIEILNLEISLIQIKTCK